MLGIVELLQMLVETGIQKNFPDSANNLEQKTIGRKQEVSNKLHIQSC